MNPLKYLFFLMLPLCILHTGCGDFMDTAVETRYLEEDVFVDYSRISKTGYGVYTALFSFGFDRISSAMLASACDEADHADVNSSVHYFNNGTWTATSNPDNVWSTFYTAIRRANMFLEESADYRLILLRDTLIPSNRENYLYQVRDIEWLRAEVRFLRAFYHLELLKRYGGIPVMKEVIDDESTLVNRQRDSFETGVNFVVDECDAVIPLLKDSWVDFDGNKWRGRATKGAAQALKTRALLYAASPLNNPANDPDKWIRAAQAAHDIIRAGLYSLHTDYGGLFNLGNGSDGNPEVLFAVQRWNENTFEKNNYPVGYDQGGQAVTCPSQNLVNAYEMKATGKTIGEPGSGYDPEKPYDGRDPRLTMSVIVNNSTFNGRKVECWVGGIDGIGKLKATTTGYYLKKYVRENLNLTQNQTGVHSWILFRYGEVLLNYAEAMNEAYGPESKGGLTMSAKAAIDAVRSRNGVAMPVLPPGLTQDEMRERIRNERRVELAFEEHRFFDVRRWKIAMTTENLPLMAMQTVKTSWNDEFEYLVFKKENRIFKEYMYLHPIPETEVLKGALVQNPGWEWE
ncbi:MAG: RagB/SusD family nutrient uptake outer membrane protein [Bacteroidales bacterium]|nr:RagB/SusD family nutrient uptake outer membrane protein [Bacteroidales bacterium]